MSLVTPRRCEPLAAAIVILPLTIGAASATATAASNEAFAGPAVPLPSSALMGLIMLGGVAAFLRFPGHRRKRP